MDALSQSNPSAWRLRYPEPTSPSNCIRNISFSATSDAERVLDVYLPTLTSHPPGVVIVSGYPSRGLKQHFGRSAREFGSAVSWSEALAAEGIAAITYDAVDPIVDLPAVLDWVRDRGGAIGIDVERIGVFACSGNVPTALMNLNRKLRCAALLYGFMLDAPGTTHVADAAHQFGFAYPSIEIERIDSSVRTLIVRAGRDTFSGLNDSIDHFMRASLEHNLPLHLINHATGVHAFDLLDDSATTRTVITQVLQFVKDALGVNV